MVLTLVFSQLQVLLSHLWEKEGKKRKEKGKEGKRNRKVKEGRKKEFKKERRTERKKEF